MPGQSVARTVGQGSHAPGGRGHVAGAGGHAPPEQRAAPPGDRGHATERAWAARTPKAGVVPPGGQGSRTSMGRGRGHTRRGGKGSARGCAHQGEGARPWGRERREERGTHHELNGRQQLLTWIIPRAGREVQEREREDTSHGKERMGVVASMGGGRVAWACA